MATGQTTARDNRISLKPGDTAVFALRFSEGKNVGDSQFPPFRPNFMFTTTDDRRLFLSDEDADDLVRGMRNAQIQAGDLMRVTNAKIRGGGHALRVERVSDASEPESDSKLERDLRASVEAARAGRLNGAGAPTRYADEKSGLILDKVVHAPAAVVNAHGPRLEEAKPSQGTTQPPSLNHNAVTPIAAKLSSALCAAVDAALECTAYASRLGWEIQFTEEDLRCLAATAFIAADRRAS